MVQLFRQAFGEFDQNAPIGRFFNFVERNDEPQTLDDVQIQLMFVQQAQQPLSPRFAIVRAHA